MTQPSEILLPEIIKCVQAGGLKTIEQARRTGTKLVIMGKDGQVIEITPDEAEAMLEAEKTK